MSNSFLAMKFFLILVIFQTILYFALQSNIEVFQSGTDIQSLEQIQGQSSSNDIGLYDTGKFILQVAFVEYFGFPVWLAVLISLFKFLLVIAIFIALRGGG